MKDHLIFDTTDAGTITDSDSVGAFVRAGDDGTLIGHVADALKVNFSNTTIDVTATDLDIRDLTQTDEVTVFQGTDPWVVSATDLDIRDLAFATDSVDVSGSSVSITGDVNVTQGTSPWVVSATDLDIRDLDASQDNVAIDGISAGGNALVINADGSLNVNADISVVNGSDKAEDSAHVSADIGTYVLAVRQDTLAASTSADGDYASFKVSEAGALYVNLAESSGTLEVSDAALADTAIVSAAEVLDTADTAQAAVASPLADRKYLSIYNMDNKKIFIGGSTVTSANGFPVSPGSYIEMRAGAASAVFFVGSTGATPEIRSLELS